MLIHHLGRGTSEHRLAGQHIPERRAQRVEVRTDVHTNPCKLFWAGERRRPGKSPEYRNLSTWFIDRLGKAEVDNLRDHSAFLLKAHHNVAGFDVPVNELLLVDRSQTCGHLRRNFHGQLYGKPTGSSDQALKRFPTDKLHRIEIIAVGFAKVEDRSNVWMTQACGRPGFT